MVTKGNCSPGRKVVRGPGHFPPRKYGPNCIVPHIAANVVVSSRADFLSISFNTDWEWGNQDGGSGKTGVLQDFSVDEDGWIVSYYLPFCS